MHAVRHLQIIIAAVLLASLTSLCGVARADSLDPPALAAPAAGATLSTNPTFNWSVVPRASRYRIQVSTTAAFSDIVYTSDQVGTTATPTTELPLGTLHWRVATFDGAGTVGSFSVARTVTRNQAAPPVLVSPADGVTLKYPDDPAVLTWQPVTGAKFYKVEIDDEDTFTNATAYTTDATSLHLPNSLPSNVQRFWRVEAVSTDPNVTTAWSNANDLRSFAIAWPAATKPTLLTPLDSPNGEPRDDIDFSWTAVPGAAKYQWQMSTAPDFNTLLTTQTTAATHYRPLNTISQDTYYWRVRGLQPNGDPTSWSIVGTFNREWLDQNGLPARPAVSLTDFDPLTGGTQIESDQMSVSWTAIPRASYYRLEISKDPTFLSDDPLVKRTCTTPNTTWTPYLSGTYNGTTGFGACDWMGTQSTPDSTRFVVPGQTYYVRVRAVDLTPSNATITTLWSNETRPGGSDPGTASFSLTIPTRAGTDPTQPAQIISSPSTSGSPLLTWKPVAGADAYLVGMSRDSSFNTPVVTGTYFTTTDTMLELNQLLLDNTAGQPYYWYVLPCSHFAGAGDVRNLCDVGPSLAINKPPERSFEKHGLAVTGLSGTATQSDTVALGWNDQLQTSPTGGGVNFYELEISNSGGTVVDDVKTDATGYTPIDNSYPNGQYSWRVRAIDAAGTGLAWSTTESFAKTSSTPVPQAPISDGTLPVLRWTPTAFAGSYDVEVYRGVDHAFPPGNKVSSASVTGRSYPVSVPATSLPADTYSWRVRQVDAYGKPGPWSSDVLPFTIGGTKPALTAPLNNASVGTPSLVFEWSRVPGAVTYKFESSPTDGFGDIAETATTTENRYSTSRTYTSGPYFWRVSALDGAGNLLAQSDVSKVTALTAPAQVTASAVRDGAKVTVSWPAPVTGGTALTGYVLRYRAAGAAQWTESVKAGDVTSVALDNLSPSQVYEAQVAAVNAVGVGPFSATVSALTPALPTAPTNLTIAQATTGLRAVWIKPSGGEIPITGYVVRVTPKAGGTPVESTSAATTATITGLADGTTYTVEVAAVNDMGRGPFISAEGTTKAAAPAPTPGPSSTPTPVPTASPSVAPTNTPASAFTPSPTAIAGVAPTVTPTATPPAPKCVVPGVKGKPKAAAKNAVIKAGCKVKRFRGTKSGFVHRQSPKAGTVLAVGGSVTLTLSKRR